MKKWTSFFVLVLVMSSVQAVDINQATEAELDGLRGIGPPFTRRLLEARQHQSFKDWQDLIARVSGMGPGIAKSLSEQGLTVQGRSYEPDQPGKHSKKLDQPKP